MSRKSTRAPRSVPNIWDGYVPPSALPEPDEAHFYLGANPHHDPACETASPDRCPRCQAEGQIRPGTVEVCGRCLRYGFDHRVAEQLRQERARSEDQRNATAARQKAELDERRIRKLAKRAEHT